MKAYGHLTYEERDRIALLRAEGLCPSQIAQEIGRPSCTVGRELKRNSNGDGGYRPVSAEGRYRVRETGRRTFLDVFSAQVPREARRTPADARHGVPGALRHPPGYRVSQQGF